MGLTSNTHTELGAPVVETEASEPVLFGVLLAGCTVEGVGDCVGVVDRGAIEGRLDGHDCS